MAENLMGHSGYLSYNMMGPGPTFVVHSQNFNQRYFRRWARDKPACSTVTVFWQDSIYTLDVQRPFKRRGFHQVGCFFK